LHGAMASDFTVTWQYENNCFFFVLFWIKFHVFIQLDVSPPSFDTGVDTGAWNCVGFNINCNGLWLLNFNYDKKWIAKIIYFPEKTRRTSSGSTCPSRTVCGTCGRRRWRTVSAGSRRWRRTRSTSRPTGRSRTDPDADRRRSTTWYAKLRVTRSQSYDF
jgi:hypothetical protein